MRWDGGWVGHVYDELEALELLYQILCDYVIE